MSVKLRSFRSHDLDSLYTISLATGAGGGDASALYRDGRMMGHIYSAPYALLRPDAVFVAEDDDGVAGFVVGAIDTVSFEARLERDWWPALRARYDDPSGTPPESWTADQRRCLMIHHPRRTPDAITSAYPAHVHLNLLPRLQGRGVGSALLDLWCATIRASATHVGVSASNPRAVRFWRRHGFEGLELADDRTIWLGRRDAQSSGTPPKI